MATTTIFHRSVLTRPISLKHLTSNRRYATALPRPPPPTRKPSVTTFAGPAHPRPVFAPSRRVPLYRRLWPIALAVTTLGSWVAFFCYIANEAKATSSIVEKTLRAATMDPKLRAALGDDVRPHPEWWLNGRPRIRGELDQLHGNIELSVRLCGSRGDGTLYFKSTRKAEGIPYDTLRFEVIADDGTVLKLDPKAADT
ncbi:cytochrome oxidase complex assembly protein 1-domain-containing protein [Mycena polygramma]|nr:cytochrome oxidase complex assembly protein 1-domain-containing protein [Mycena polygramma]